MFCIYLRTNSDLCHLQHKLIGFYNRDEKCLQRGTDWVFKKRGLRFGFKGLKKQSTSITKLLMVYFLTFLLRPLSVTEIKVQLQKQRPSETAVTSKRDDEKAKLCTRQYNPNGSKCHKLTPERRYPSAAPEQTTTTIIVTTEQRDV